ncbi:MAG: hypothetical protein VB084_13435 [Syntrophomonadaceae bacterium]|nr:hypothetical protein [Syntrophomonadaceae bacterium]
MEKKLKTIGIAVMAAGVFIGLLVLFNIDYDEYSLARKLYEGLPSNTFAQVKFTTAFQTLIFQIGIVVMIILMSVMSGLAFLGFGEIIKRLERIEGEIQIDQQSENVE